MQSIFISGFSYARQVLDKIHIEVRPGECICLLGRSGVGKTTLLRLLSGLEPSYQTSNNATYLTQHDTLLPWLTVVDNVALGARLRGESVADHTLKCVLELVQLEHDGHKYPHELSGGMRQRVHFARLLLEDRPLVLLDEPFSALDALTRRELYPIVRRIFSKKSVILVTHDPWEAMDLGDRIYVLSGQPASLLPQDMKPLGTPHILKALAA